MSGSSLKDANFARARLEGSVFRNTSFEAAGLTEILMRDVDATGACFQNADLSRAVLTDSNFCSSDWRKATLNETAFGGCSLNKADLREAKFISTSLSRSSCDESLWGLTVVANVDLRGLRGLESTEHRGPSSVGFDSLVRSRGEVPEEFLRGIGTPEAIRTYLKSLIGQPIEFYSCFISYSTKDQAFASRLYADLQAHRVRCWFAPHDIKSGRKIHEQIDEAIRIYDRLLLVLSDASMNSEWVKTEISNARQKELREGRQMLFPIGLTQFEKVKNWKAFDADIGKDSAREVREYFIPDFSNWKDHDSYQIAFARLLRDLKAQGSRPAVE